MIKQRRLLRKRDGGQRAAFWSDAAAREPTQHPKTQIDTPFYSFSFSFQALGHFYHMSLPNMEQCDYLFKCESCESVMILQWFQLVTLGLERLTSCHVLSWMCFKSTRRLPLGQSFHRNACVAEIKQLRPKCGIQVRALYRSLAVAGQERYRAITSAYNLYASIHCVGIIVGLLVRSSYSI